jgi:hypothetical protein
MTHAVVTDERTDTTNRGDSTMSKHHSLRDVLRCSMHIKRVLHASDLCGVLTVNYFHPPMSITSPHSSLGL